MWPTTFSRSGEATRLSKWPLVRFVIIPSIFACSPTWSASMTDRSPTLDNAAQARERAQLEREIMSPSIAKNDREWWAMEEIETLRKIESIAREVTEECRGDQTPALGTLARLEDALHAAWCRRNPKPNPKPQISPVAKRRLFAEPHRYVVR